METICRTLTCVMAHWSTTTELWFGKSGQPYSWAANLIEPIKRLNGWFWVQLLESIAYVLSLDDLRFWMNYEKFDWWGISSDAPFSNVQKLVDLNAAQKKPNRGLTKSHKLPTTRWIITPVDPRNRFRQIQIILDAISTRKLSFKAQWATHNTWTSQFFKSWIYSNRERVIQWAVYNYWWYQHSIFDTLLKGQ